MFRQETIWPLSQSYGGQKLRGILLSSLGHWWLSFPLDPDRNVSGASKLLIHPRHPKHTSQELASTISNTSELHRGTCRLGEFSGLVAECSSSPGMGPKTLAFAASESELQSVNPNCLWKTGKNQCHGSWAPCKAFFLGSTVGQRILRSVVRRIIKTPIILVFYCCNHKLSQP